MVRIWEIKKNNAKTNYPIFGELSHIIFDNFLINTNDTRLIQDYVLEPQRTADMSSYWNQTHGRINEKFFYYEDTIITVYNVYCVQYGCKLTRIFKCLCVRSTARRSSVFQVTVNQPTSLDNFKKTPWVEQGVRCLPSSLTRW